MSEDHPIRDLFNNPEAKNLVYRWRKNVRGGLKFSQTSAILDDFWIVGGTRWRRFKFRLKHPIVYSKHGVRTLYRKIKRLFIADRPIPLHRECKNKETMLEQYPEANNAINQKQNSNIDTAQKQNARSCRQQNHR